MIPDLLFYKLLLVALMFICILLHLWWREDRGANSQQPLKPSKSAKKLLKEPKPFAGLIHKPLCDACEQAADSTNWCGHWPLWPKAWAFELWPASLRSHPTPSSSGWWR